MAERRYFEVIHGRADFFSLIKIYRQRTRSYFQIFTNSVFLFFLSAFLFLDLSPHFSILHAKRYRNGEKKVSSSKKEVINNNLFRNLIIRNNILSPPVNIIFGPSSSNPESVGTRIFYHFRLSYFNFFLQSQGPFFRPPPLLLACGSSKLRYSYLGEMQAYTSDKCDPIGNF